MRRRINLGCMFINKKKNGHIVIECKVSKNKKKKKRRRRRRKMKKEKKKRKKESKREWQ